MGMCVSEKDSMQSITRDMLVSSKASLFEYKPTFFIKTPNCPAFILNSTLIFRVPIIENECLLSSKLFFLNNCVAYNLNRISLRWHFALGFFENFLHIPNKIP